MSTNYYFHPKEGPVEHIGKCSSSWSFALHVFPGVASLGDWIRRWTDPQNPGHIEDEYGHPVSVQEMLSVIMHRLVLSRQVGSVYGGPTWDLVEGDFS